MANASTTLIKRSSTGYKMPVASRTEEHLIKQIKAFINWSSSAQLAQCGYVESDDNVAGTHRIGLITKHGFEEYVGAKKAKASDTQSGPLTLETITPDEIETEPTTASLWETVKDGSSSVATRISALRKLNLDSQPIETFVAEELQRDIPEEWRNVLVFLTEDLHFESQHQIALGERLLKIATDLQGSSRVGDNKVVWAAMRRAATLLSRTPERFTSFLDRRGLVDTRYVALLCIQRMFHNAPPSDNEVPRSISDRIVAFAMKFLDPDVFAGGEFASIAQGAILALASLGDDRLLNMIAESKKLGRRWLNHQLKMGLTETLETWKTKGMTLDHPAISRIVQALALLS